MNGSTQQKIVNDGIRTLNNALTAIGKDRIDHLDGVRSCSRRCLIAKFGGTRTAFDGIGLHVRSMKQANLIAEAWGTESSAVDAAREDRNLGYKDYNAYVIAPEELVKLAATFDDGDLKGVETEVGYARPQFKDSGFQTIYRVHSTIKQRSTLQVTVSEAIELTNRLFG